MPASLIATGALIWRTLDALAMRSGEKSGLVSRARGVSSIPGPQAAPARDLAGALLAAGVPWLVYLRTLCPTVYGLDSAELTTGAYVLGIVHAPGSPVFLLLGHLFTWLPFGDVGLRVNLLSACAAAAALGFVYGIHRALGAGLLTAVAATWALAFSYYYWISAVAAELYALQGCFAAGLLYAALRWRDRWTPARLAALGFAFGVGLGVHLSLVFFGPSLALLVLTGSSEARRRPSWWLAGCGAALVGASAYIYLPLRSDAPLNFARELGVDVGTWHGFWWMVSARMFQEHLFAVPATSWPSELLVYTHRLWSNFLGLGCLLGAAGLAADLPRRPALHASLLLALVLYLAFMLTFSVVDKEVMLGPTFVIWSIWVGLGARALLGRATPASGEMGNERPSATRTFGLSAGSEPRATSIPLVVLALAALAVNFGYADLSQDRSARERGEAILAALPPGAVFVGTWRDVPILDYLRLVEQRRPDVETINLFFVSTTAREGLVDRYAEDGRAVFTSQPGALSRRLVFVPNPACDCLELAGYRHAGG